MAEHDWGPSLVGHGEKQCQRCGMTNREAWVLGDQCPKPALPDVKCEPAKDADHREEILEMVAGEPVAYRYRWQIDGKIGYRRSIGSMAMAPRNLSP